MKIQNILEVKSNNNVELMTAELTKNEKLYNMLVKKGIKLMKGINDNSKESFLKMNNVLVDDVKQAMQYVISNIKNKNKNMTDDMLPISNKLLRNIFKQINIDVEYYGKMYNY